MNRDRDLRLDRRPAGQEANRIFPSSRTDIVRRSGVAGRCRHPSHPHQMPRTPRPTSVYSARRRIRRPGAMLPTSPVAPPDRSEPGSGRPNYGLIASFSIGAALGRYDRQSEAGERSVRAALLAHQNWKIARLSGPWRETGLEMYHAGMLNNIRDRSPGVCRRTPTGQLRHGDSRRDHRHGPQPVFLVEDSPGVWAVSAIRAKPLGW